MRIGVGLPTSTPGASGPVLLEWARRAEQRRFSSLGVTDRLVYDCADPLVALAAAAAVTSRVRLVTMIVIGPVRETAVLAKQAASVDQLSGGRLVLGVGLGARRDDYEAAGARWSDRGRRLSGQLAALRDVWEGEAVGPRPARPGGPQLLVGGGSGPAFLRAARCA
ncbi:MAG: LLM class flavin-dependent oxidoreductase, partial [Egibacteraceae bacterium]